MITPKPLTAVVIGAGTINSAAYDLIGIADIDPEARTRIARETGVSCYAEAEELLVTRAADPVCVSTHAATHLPLVCLAVEKLRPRGLLVEKPLGDSVNAGIRWLQCSPNSSGPHPLSRS